MDNSIMTKTMCRTIAWDSPAPKLIPDWMALAVLAVICAAAVAYAGAVSLSAVDPTAIWDFAARSGT